MKKLPAKTIHAGKSNVKRIKCPALLGILAAVSLDAHAAMLFDFYASDWTGPNNSWASRTGSQTFFYDTFNGSAPQKGTNTIGAVPVVFASFDGNDFFTTTLSQTNRSWAGLSEFSITIVFRSNTGISSSETDINAFWNQEGILGFEVNGVGQGEFAIGLYNDGTASGAVAAGTGLASTDVGTSGGRINDNAWHTLTLVVDDLGSGTFKQTVYVDGALVDQDLALTYGGGSSTIADQPFSLGNIRFGGTNSNPFVGGVAALRFDDTPLQASDITALHSTYLGLVPRGGSTYLIDFGRNNGTDGNITTGPDANGRYWNNMQSPTTDTTGYRLIGGMVNSTNGASAISTEIIGMWQANGRLNGGLFGTNGPQSALLGDLAIETATEDYYFLTAADSATGMVRITGLNPSRTYHLMFFGSREFNGETRRTSFSAGGKTASVTTSGNNIGSNGAYDGNDNSLAGLYSVSPTTGGVIDVNVSLASGSFGYINAMKIQEAPSLKESLVLIDFGPEGGRHSVGSADANGNWWSYVTGVTGTAGNVSNLTTAAGTISSPGMNISVNWTGEVGVNGDPLANWAINAGEVQASLNKGRFGFFDVVKNGLYFNSTLTPSIYLTGLDNSKVYNLTFYGARGNFTRTTTYAVGTNSVSLQTGTAPTGWNSNTVVTLYGLAPASGQLKIDLSATGGFGYLSAMEIESAVRLTLTNSLAMLGPDGVTPLTGNASTGSLVQLIVAGGGAIDPASTTTPGATTGDDYILSAFNNPTFVGGGAATNAGLLLQNMVFNESYAGLPVYVRYWNASSLTTTSSYGNSPIFYLPSGGTPGQTRVDILPVGSNQTVSYQIPTLTEWGLILLVALLVGIGARRILGRSAIASSEST